MGDWSRAVVVIAGGALAVTVAVRAESRPTARPHDSRDPSIRRLDSSQIATAPVRAESVLSVHRVRLEPAPPSVVKPSVVLKFDLVNDGLATVRDVILEVAIRQKSSTDADVAAQVVAGPFVIRANVDLQAGYTLNYEMLLRNLPSDCNCVADVAIVTAHVTAGPAATTSR
jgi:hypothetical protein